MDSQNHVDLATSRAFDVVCAGDPLLKLRAAARRGRPPAGALGVAVALAAAGRRVGLCSTLADDRQGRAWRQALSARGVDTGGVKLAVPRRGRLLVPGAPMEFDGGAEADTDLEVPRGWQAQILLLSGLVPLTSRAAAFCRAARRARKDGTLVVLDFDASLRAWSGQDPRTVRMVLRECDVARCSVADLAVLGMDARSAREALRPDAVLVVSDAEGGAMASGAFGEVSVAPTAPGEGAAKRGRGAEREGDAFVAALCLGLLRRGEPGMTAEATWSRTLQKAVAAHVGEDRDG